MQNTFAMKGARKSFASPDEVKKQWLKNKQLIGLHTLSFETKGIKTEEAKDLA
jgi:hypothetical protein